MFNILVLSTDKARLNVAETGGGIFSTYIKYAEVSCPSSVVVLKKGSFPSQLYTSWNISVLCFHFLFSIHLSYKILDGGDAINGVSLSCPTPLTYKSLEGYLT